MRVRYTFKKLRQTFWARDETKTLRDSEVQPGQIVLVQNRVEQAQKCDI